MTTPAHYFLDLPGGHQQGGGWPSLQKIFYRSSLYPVFLNRKIPDRLRGAPEGAWPLMRSRFKHPNTLGFTDSTVPLMDTPWDQGQYDPETWQGLQEFGWLEHLRTSGADTARHQARQLTKSWIEAFDRWDAFAWRPDVLGYRLSNWFAAGQFLFKGTDDDLYQAFLKSAAVQTRHLLRTISSLQGEPRLFLGLKGLIYGGLCMPGFEQALEKGLQALDKEMDYQIFPDGGHIDRNPSLLLGLLAHLIDIREALTIAQIEIPITLQSTIDRMVPLVRAFRMGDGGLSLFNGSFEEGSDVVDTVLAKSGVKGKALSNAPHSGFQRIASGKTVIITDTGFPPTDKSRGLAHAGTLSFEMSVGKQRVIVNCGTSAMDEARWREAARLTAAHSTVVIDDSNSSEILDNGHIGRRPTEVSHLRKEADGNIWLETSHNGYLSSKQLIHRRNLFLNGSGDDFRGEDIISGSGGKRATVRFHLHPQIHASVVGDGSTVLLKLPRGPGWRFLAKGGDIDLTESIYLGDGGVPRRTEQIVISTPLNEYGATVKWRFSKVSG